MGVPGVGVCGQNICYHVAAFVIPPNLICNKKLKFDILTPRDVGVSGQNICCHVAAFVTPFNLICIMTVEF